MHACFVLEARPGHDRPSATAPEGLPLKKTVQKIPHVLWALPCPLLSGVHADPSAVQQEVAAGPLHHHPAVGAPSPARVHPVASCFLPEQHFLQGPPWSESAPQAPEALPGTWSRAGLCVAAAPAVRADAEGRVLAPALQVRPQTAGPSRDACGVKSAAWSLLTAAPRLFWELELRPWPRCSHPPNSRESGRGKGRSLLCHIPRAPAGHSWSGWGQGELRWAPGGGGAATSHVPGQLRLRASGACPRWWRRPRGLLQRPQSVPRGAARSARLAAQKRRLCPLHSAERSCVLSSPVSRPSPAQARGALAHCPGLAARDNAQSRVAQPTQWLGPGPGPGGSRRARALGVGPWRGAQDTGDEPWSLPSAPSPMPTGVPGIAGCPGFPLRKPPPGPAGGGLWELMEGSLGKQWGSSGGLLPDEYPAPAGGVPRAREQRGAGGGSPGTACGSGPVVSFGVCGVRCRPPGARLRAENQRVPSTPYPMSLEPPSCLLDGVGRGQSSGVLLVTRPPGDFNALFSALHSLYHFLSSGHSELGPCGLKHACVACVCVYACARLGVHVCECVWAWGGFLAL